MPFGLVLIGTAKRVERRFGERTADQLERNRQA